MARALRGRFARKPRGLRACVAATVAAVGLAVHAAKPVELRLSVETPPPHARNVASARWAEAIERRSNGALKVRIFPSAQLYDSGGAIKALASGALDLSVQASPTLSSIEPNLAVIALPMFFGATREQGRACSTGRSAASSTHGSNRKAFS